jgi:hypothetical protein
VAGQCCLASASASGPVAASLLAGAG